MAARQSLRPAKIPVDIELAESVHTLQFLEPVQWHFACTRHELQQLGALLFVKAAYSAPEPLDLRRRRGVVVIFGVVLPVINIYIRKA